MTEKYSIVVVGRDRFSTTEKCLDVLIKNTPEIYDLIVVLGGVPDKSKSKLTEKFKNKAQFIFEDRFLNPAESRNIGLRAAKTRLAVLMDNDVDVWPGWIEPLIECQQQTGAAMVVPVILEGGPEIHTAGNDFYVSYENGKAFGHKELRFRGMVIGQGKTNLKRQRTDYGELHCQIVVVETALRLGVYDERLREVGECDSGLTWTKAGCEMWFEPNSIVDYEIPGPIKAEDIRFFIWKWDMRGIFKGYQHFYQKWNIDVTEHHSFQDWLLSFNRKLGFLPRAFPCELSLRIDQLLRFVPQVFAKMFMLALSPWRRFKAWRLGYYEWPRF